MTIAVVVQQAKRGSTVLAGIIAPEYQGETGLLLQNGGKEVCLIYSRFLGGRLVLPYPVIRASWVQQLPSSARTANDPDPSGRKCLITPTGKET